ELWRNHPVIVIGAATGSGKTTQLPKIAAELGWGNNGMIGCTQPRRIAATAMARRVAAETGGECGGAVGYQVRFDEQLSEQTCIKFMTDGILLAETRSDRQLRRYSCIIIDEAHERSLNIDFLLGYLKELLIKRKDLKIAISSATLDLELFSRFFDNAPVVEVEGRTFPVEDHYLPPLDADEELDEHLARAVEHLSAIDPRGDILAFLPGEREIRECTALLTGRKLPNTEILPLFARLSNADQQKVFRTGGRRRIILATNVAETSITIPGIRFCIDSGLARISRYNPRNRIQELRVETISKASIRQRRGRCGRTSEGICVHMYSEDDFHRCDDYTDPEIRRSSLAGVILQMAALHLPRIDRFQFIDPPPPALIREGMRTLEDLGAIHPGAGTLTADGRVLSRLPIDPQLGKMMLEGRKRNVLREIIIITAFLSIADPRERPMEKQKAADDAHRKYKDERSDFVMVLKLFYALKTALGENFSNGLLRRYTKENYLNFNRMREWLNLVSELIDHARELSWRLDPEEPDPERIAYDPLHIAILSGIPRQIAKYVPEYQYFLGTGGRKFVIFPGSGLARRKKMPAWLLSFALMET
ncbi:MAG: ATP-dependent RNA helicase HrpA, partial [Lentisphaeria bacterium]|nr:ATP-dependent RNA helicase HrpA [Lentisphaeria bacterium]